MNINRELNSLINKNLVKILKLRNFKSLKKDGSYVSKGDIFIQRLVKKFINENYNKNDFLLVSEENFKNQNIDYKKYRNIFILDPIDGTENFISGIPIWGISFCWYKNNKHKDSTICLPELNLSISKKFKSNKNKSRIVALSSSNNKLLKKINNLNEIRITGCCVYNIYNVLHGKFTSYSNKKANLWDFIAGFNIAAENDIPVYVNGKKYNGEILQPNKKYNIKIKNK